MRQLREVSGCFTGCRLRPAQQGRRAALRESTAQGVQENHERQVVCPAEQGDHDREQEQPGQERDREYRDPGSTVPSLLAATM
jgi:hypothetical protein